REKDFSKYDAVYHVAGIAHQKESEANCELYYRINRDLALETARKAKDEGVKQFIYLSSMSVYGMEVGVITEQTQPNPKTNYGKSKLEAECGLASLRDDDFKVCILRPPMVYGPRCKGNFSLIIDIVKRFPVFPRIRNERSLIYVENLCGFVRLAIDNKLDGLFFPDNREHVQTQAIAEAAAAVYGKKVYFSVLLGWCVAVLRLFVPKARKAFGSLVYENLERHTYSYCDVDNAESLKKSVVAD
ncbi:MAG: NAD-dependent epimerase/dehydratase family protein, partial [Aristaeellaceae bacterium]